MRRTLSRTGGTVRHDHQPHWSRFNASRRWRAGRMYERLRLQKSERDAWEGKRSRIARKKKGRKAQSGSLREYLETVPGWKKLTTWKLLKLAVENFPERRRESLRRQIIALKK